jgi:hypothetical protein
MEADEAGTLATAQSRSSQVEPHMRLLPGGLLMDDKELWRERLRRIDEAMPALPMLAAYIKRCQEAAPKWPKWIEYLGGLVVLVFVAFGLGVFGNRSYIPFGAVWLLFAVCVLNIRKAAPQFPEFGIFLGWFFLAVMAVFIGYAALHAGK